jgi:tRNA threonylcarbamoyladenosine biosynthesis protein TsaE
LLKAGDVICLEGDLGSGKTTLTQGIGRGLGVDAAITSPTFIIVNEYLVRNQPHKLCHIDLYRIETSIEARTLGLEDYFYGDAICVIEWAERAVNILPKERLWISLRYLRNSERHFEFLASGARYEELLRHLFQETGGLVLATSS